MSTRGEVLFHPVNGVAEQTWNGFSWPASLFGIFWLLLKGHPFHFTFMLALVLVSGGLAVPFIWIVYGAIGNGIHKRSLLKQGYLTEAQWKMKSEESAAAAKPASSLLRDDPLDRIRELADMREKGILTEDEFIAQKRRILNS